MGLATTLLDLFTDMSLMLLYASFAANFYEYDNWSEVFPDEFGTGLWNNIENVVQSRHRRRHRSCLVV